MTVGSSLNGRFIDRQQATVWRSGSTVVEMYYNFGWNFNHNLLWQISVVLYWDQANTLADRSEGLMRVYEMDVSSPF